MLPVHYLGTNAGLDGVNASGFFEPSALTCEAKAAAFPAELLIVSDASVLREPPISAKTSVCCTGPPPDVIVVVVFEWPTGNISGPVIVVGYSKKTI